MSRIAVLGAKRSEGPVSALNVGMCMAQHLSLTAQSGHWPPPQNAAVRPVIAALCLWLSQGC
ncbi:MAG: hypothetical protein ACJASZ_002393 [Yoonia sp.]